MAIVRLVARLIFLLWLTKAVAAASIAKPGCQPSCGNVKIPFPFGIGERCYMHEAFDVSCNDTSGTSSPFLRSINMELLNVSLTGTVRVKNQVFSWNCNNSARDIAPPAVDLLGSPFKFSELENRFTAIACDYFAYMTNENYHFLGGCMSVCYSDNATEIQKEGGCIGKDCCRIMIPPDLKYATVQTTVMIHDNNETKDCRFAFIGEEVPFDEKKTIIMAKQGRGLDYVPAVLQWGVSRGSLCRLGNSPPAPFCGYNGYCWTNLSSSHLCVCRKGSINDSDNAKDACQDEGKSCTGKDYNQCEIICFNTTKNKNCSDCPQGYRGVGGTICYPEHPYEEKVFHSKVKLFILLGCFGGFGTILLVILVTWLLWKAVQRRKEIKLKQKYFKKNGGMLLEQEVSTTQGNVEKAKLFSSKELEKATDHYNENRILGKGGQGTVYKGMLTDGKIIAVKKSKVLRETQLVQFINEVVILSKIDHRNVVKLLGCCLETEVPLLVYEFIPNGTLFQHLHDPNDEFPLTWEMRLRIAAEVADALAYLHSAASMPIYHRDIKSANILLDNKYRAKVSDFGLARSVSIDQTHVSTLVQGTFGYLDPEYFRSSQFTEKSDVYSFGVVLAELLTSRKAVCSTRSENEKSLVNFFLQSMEEENLLLEIIDARVLKEAELEAVIAVAKLAKRCLNLNGRKRPTMKEVAKELEGIKALQGVSSTIDQQILLEVGNSKGEFTGPWDAAASSSSKSCLESGLTSFDIEPLLSGSH